MREDDAGRGDSRERLNPAARTTRRVLALAVALVVSLSLMGGAGLSTGAGGYGVADKAEAQTSTVSVKGCTGTQVKLKANEKRMLDLHNRERADRGLAKLCVHPKLQNTARAHSADMIKRDYFSHTTKGSGESPCERVTDAGYRWRSCGENITFGTGNTGNAGPRFEAWMNSDGHRANILNPGYREIGVGAVTGEYSGYRDATMWTSNFGRR